jgi:hypothetical protein
MEHRDIGNNFLNRTPFTQKITEKIDKWDYLKPVSFCSRHWWLTPIILVTWKAKTRSISVQSETR